MAEISSPNRPNKKPNRKKPEEPSLIKTVDTLLEYFGHHRGSEVTNIDSSSVVGVPPLLDPMLMRVSSLIAGQGLGRLFTRAIIVLESGCEEFSNIQGLGQIRFPEGNIKACFEEIRQVLEREHLAG